MALSMDVIPSQRNLLESFPFIKTEPITRPAPIIIVIKLSTIERIFFLRMLKTIAHFEPLYHSNMVLNFKL